MTRFPDHPFWDFSLEVYMAPGVGEACLDLQERHGLDVNLLLFCLWVGASGRGALEDAEVGGLMSAVGAWHEEIVRALRGVRTRMKGGMPPAPDALAESLRQRVQKIEIDCEHTEQLMLAASIDRTADDSRSRGDRAADAAANVAGYFRGLGREPTDADRSCLAVMFGVAFSGVPPARIDELCARL